MGERAHAVTGRPRSRRGPCALRRASRRFLSPLIRSEGRPRCTVVLCDDQPGFRQVVSVVVGLELDMEVVGEAGNGREAIELVGELHPDVLVLDIAMPVMDGLEALPHLRAASPETRIVMLTGVATESIRERALAGGARLFMEKGADVEAIARQIREICGQD